MPPLNFPSAKHNTDTSTIVAPQAAADAVVRRRYPLAARRSAASPTGCMLGVVLIRPSSVAAPHQFSSELSRCAAAYVRSKPHHLYLLSAACAHRVSLSLKFSRSLTYLSLSRRTTPQLLSSCSVPTAPSPRSSRRLF